MRKILPLPSFDYLHQLFHYNPETGVLMWRGGKREGYQAGWGGRHLNVMISQQDYKAHRIIWKMMTGSDPEAQIDHKNLDKKDNRWSNLREATHLQNMMNSSGKKGRDLPKGVYYQRGRYFSTIRRYGKTYPIGYFGTLNEARAAYLAFAKQMDGEFYHP